MDVDYIFAVICLLLRLDLSFSAATCEEAYLEGSTSTGVKTLQYNGYSFKAFCIYNGDGTGWFYPSTEAVTSNGTFVLNLHNQYLYRDQARVRVIMNDGRQKDSTIRQINAHNYRDLTFMLNSAAGFANPHNTGKYSPSYLYVGFLDRNTAASRTVQGFNSDDRDISFRNCDGNPNSYFAFYPVTSYRSRPYGLGATYPMTNTWRQGVNRQPFVRNEDIIPRNELNKFKFSVEIHMGGCGTIEVSSDWSSKPHHRLSSSTAALGFKFYMSSSCHTNPCGYHGTCRTSGTRFICDCMPGWTGTLCSQEISRCRTSQCRNQRSSGSKTANIDELPATCEQAYKLGSTASGVKILHYNGYSFKAFCMYNSDNTGWFYPSTNAVVNNRSFVLNLASQYSFRDQARIRIFMNSGIQKDSTLNQLYRYRTRNLTFMVNSAAGFTNPHNTRQYSPNYLFVGFLDKATARARTVQGWRADGKDITFQNCDANPNSYFAFYPVTTYRSKPYGLGAVYPVSNIWRQGVNTLPRVASAESIPNYEVHNFKFGVEIHMGGCGTIELSNDWPLRQSHRLHSNGAALGLKFRMPDRCTPMTCHSHGTCTDRGIDITCQCDNGWTGSRCEKWINPCADSPCEHGGLCRTKGSSYQCDCTSTGYTGTDCQTDINECRNDPCQNNGVCSNTAGSFTCDCAGTGYTGNKCQTGLNLCATNPCEHGGLCTSTGSSYSCDCSSTGYTGVNCQTDINECRGNPCKHHGICSNTPGHFSCDCTGTGYKGTMCQTDVNECRSDPCQHHGVCSNTPGSFTCNCTGTGYKGNTCQRDINECRHRPCQNDGVCHNTPGFYSCDCEGTGYRGPTCASDIDECYSNDPCLNNGICIKLPGSYRCSCSGSGFTGRNCHIDVNECAEDPCQHGGRCTNSVGSYTCNCEGTGYTGPTCETDASVISECVSNPCLNGGTCINIGGLYHCVCDGTGFTGSLCQQEEDTWGIWGRN